MPEILEQIVLWANSRNMPSVRSSQRMGRAESGFRFCFRFRLDEAAAVRS